MQSLTINETIIAVIGLCVSIAPFAWLFWYLSLGPESEIIRKRFARTTTKKTQ